MKYSAFLLLISFGVAVLGCRNSSTTSHGNNEPVSINGKQEVCYNQISMKELPKPVSRVLAVDQSGYKVKNVYQASDGTYKADIEKGTDHLHLYFSKSGELKEVK